MKWADLNSIPINLSFAAEMKWMIEMKPAVNFNQTSISNKRQKERKIDGIENWVSAPALIEFRQPIKSLLSWIEIRSTIRDFNERRDLMARNQSISSSLAHLNLASIKNSNIKIFKFFQSALRFARITVIILFYFSLISFSSIIQSNFNKKKEWPQTSRKLKLGIVSVSFQFLNESRRQCGGLKAGLK